MNAKNNQIYNPLLGLDGTIGELINWAYRYDGDFTDEALLEISRIAKSYDLPEYKIPLLVIDSRKREKEEPDSLPYEDMKLSKLTGGNISYSEKKDYGEVEIREENDKVLISVIGMDENGIFSAAGVWSVNEFMEGDKEFLESAVGQILFYTKTY